MADQEVDAKFLYWAMSAKHPRYTTISLYDYWDESERHIALISFRAATASHAAEVEALTKAAQRLCRSFPTDDDMAAAGWDRAEIDEACNAYDALRAALKGDKP